MVPKGLVTEIFCGTVIVFLSTSVDQGVDDDILIVYCVLPVYVFETEGKACGYR